MTTSRRTALVAVAFLAGVLLPGTMRPVQAAAATQPIVAKLGHALSATSAYQMGAVRFAQLVAEKTHGTVKIEVYPNAQLGAEAALLRGLTEDTVQFALASTALAASYAPDLSALEMPFEFKDEAAAFHVLDGPVGSKIYSTLEPQGIKELSTFEAGFRNVSANRPIRSLADVRGLKIRVPQGNIYVSTWKALGAVPVTLAWNEVYTALETHVVDGAEAPIGPWTDAKFYEVQKYYSYINYIYDPIMLGVSMQFWKTLTPQQQSEVQQAAIEAAAYQRRVTQEQAAQLQKTLEAKGVKFLHPDLASFRAAAKPVYAQYETKLGPVVNEVAKAAGVQ